MSMLLKLLLYYEIGAEIDMWSFACLLPELRTAIPAFAGESEADQLAAIVEVRDTNRHFNPSLLTFITNAITIEYCIC